MSPSSPPRSSANKDGWQNPDEARGESIKIELSEEMGSADSREQSVDSTPSSTGLKPPRISAKSISTDGSEGRDLPEYCEGASSSDPAVAQLISGGGCGDFDRSPSSLRNETVSTFLKSLVVSGPGNEVFDAPVKGGEDDGMFKISEIHDTFSESAADSTLRKSLSMGDMDLDGGGGGGVGDEGTKLKRKSGEKDEEDDEATLRDATDDTSESTMPINASGPNPSRNGVETKSKSDFPAAHSTPSPPPPQRPPLVHAATVATPARLRPRLFRQKSFEIDSDSDEVRSSALDVKGEQVKATNASDHEGRDEGGPSASGVVGTSVKKSPARREHATTGGGEARRSIGGRAKVDRAKLKDKESSGEDPKSSKKAKIQGEKNKSGKPRRGSSGNRGCKRGGDGVQGSSGFHSSTLPNPKRHHGKKKRHPGLTITIDNLKESFDGYDKLVKTDADVLQHSPNFCIRFGPVRSEWVLCYFLSVQQAHL